MNVIVFGGSGFLGSHVCDELSKAGHKVTIFDKQKSPYLQEGQLMIEGDILNRDIVQQAINGQDIVYNFAGIADIEYAHDNPYETLYINQLGNLNIVQACLDEKVKRYLFASTLYVYSHLGAFYRASKQSCELTIESYAERYGVDYTILRYGSLYGPRSNATNWIYSILTNALKGKKIVRNGDGQEIREYIHVLDAARLSVKTMNESFRNQYVIISGNQSIRIKDIMIMIKEMFNNTIELQFNEEAQGSHYEITPYNFRPKLAQKIDDSAHIDLGQGILDLLYQMADERNDLDSELKKILKTRP